MPPNSPLGLIAGNGRFPFLVLDAARARGERVVVAAIKEETEPGMSERALRDSAVQVHWLSLGELSKLIETFQREGVNRAIMAGQVKHRQIFSSIRPDWRLAKLLVSIGTRNTDSLVGAIGKRTPTEPEQKNIAYGREVARQLAQYDIGQTVVIAESACVAVEAMEGTDAAIARAAEIMRTLHQDDSPESFLSRALTVVKVAKPKQDLRFDVPVVGLNTITAMHQAGATCLAVDAQRCLFLDGDRMIDSANAADISIVSS